jgi:MraZ protein
MLTGEYRYSLDDKGRIMIPVKIRYEISGNVLVITRGIEGCLWLFPTSEWKQISGQLLDSTSIFNEKARLLHRWFIAPAQEAEIDKAGRVTIPPTLRKYGGLQKDCVVLGMLNRMELWDEEVYDSYWQKREIEFQEAAEEIGEKMRDVRARQEAREQV